MTCGALITTANSAGKGILATATPPGYGPSDLQSTYGLQSATEGMRQTVAVVGAFDDPTAEADLSVYRAQYGLPACTSANGCFTKIDLSGNPVVNANWAAQDQLTLDAVSAVCSNCHLLLVEASSNAIAGSGGLGAAADAAVSAGATVVDNNYWGPEFSGETSDDSFYDFPGVAMIAPAGDGGYGVNYPAASPYVTSVGGTVLTTSGVTAWPSTGSGCSAYEAKPAFQDAATQCTGRMDNDVSAIAATASSQTPVAYYNSYDQPGWGEAGGTEVSAAVVAGIYALAGTPASGSNPVSYPYNHPSLLSDVTGGSNGTCSVAVWCTAGTGYDGPTGNGTPASVVPFTSSGMLSGSVYSGAPNLCMDDANNSNTAGNKIQIWTCNGSAAQRWTFAANGTIQHGGLCVGLTNGATTSGTPVWLYSCDGASTQQWRPYIKGAIKNVAANECLGVTNGNTASGTQLWIYSCDGSGTQQWTLPYAVPSSTGAIGSQAASGSCTGVENGSTANSTPLWLYPCNGSATQTWTVEPNGTIQAAGKCMDVLNAGTGNGTTVDLYSCNGGENQQWVARSDGSLYNPSSAKCLGLTDGDTTPETLLWIYSCDGATTQQWTLPAPPSP